MPKDKLAPETLPRDIPHAMMPRVTHDERTREAFVASMKGFVFSKVDPRMTELVEDHVKPDLEKRVGGKVNDLTTLRREVERQPEWQDWASMVRTAQDMMWHYTGRCTERQLDELKAIAETLPESGSLRIDPDFKVPNYISEIDIHCMPGGYATQADNTDIRQGAVFDRMANVFHMGRNGGALNDGRAHVVVSHLFTRFPEIDPERILEVGCTIGNSAVRTAQYFPNAEMHAIDVAAPCVRYGHYRARALGVPVHFAQMNGEATDYPDDHFDVVYTSAVLHETSRTALRNMMKEMRRILKPGGVCIHLEVPARYDELDDWGRLRGEFEVYYNNEPFWRGALTTDFGALMREAGYRDVDVGYQKSTLEARRDDRDGFGYEPLGVHRCWLLVSGRK